MNLEDESASLPNYEEEVSERKSIRKSEQKPDRPRKKQGEPKKGSSKPVILYVTILFAAAFLLLLVSFLMQQRDHAAVLQENNLSITQLQQNNQDLQLQVDDLQKQLDDANTQVKDLQNGTSTQSGQEDVTTLEKQLNAMDYLRELQRRYTAKDYAAVRTLLTEFNKKGLAAYLPKTTEIQNVMTPAEKYQEIVSAVS